MSVSQQPTPTSAKARQILRGAREVFLEQGFEGASVDEIARRAGVSKGTLYSHFGDKKALFLAFVHDGCREMVGRIVDAASADASVADTLRRIARDYLAFLFAPFTLEMFRLIVAESARFPEVGRTFFESGPAVAVHRLSRLLTAADSRGELHVPDPELAAHQFAELCRADLFYKRIFGIKTRATPAELERVADAAVETFLRAYSRASKWATEPPSGSS
jgi:AcrR family transcriptional regulator